MPAVVSLCMLVDSVYSERRTKDKRRGEKALHIDLLEKVVELTSVYLLKEYFSTHG